MALPGVPSTPAGIATLAATGLAALLPGPFSLRTIGSIKADVTFEERHEDTLEVTDHPVEQGASITDHAYLNPVSVEIKIGFKPQSAAGAALGSLTSALSGKKPIPYLNQVYQNVLALQKNRILQVIMTGKRVYTNMIIQSITCVTDVETENVLKLTLRCRQVIIVSTQAFSLPPASSMANPAKTAPTVSGGLKTLMPVA